MRRMMSIAFGLLLTLPGICAAQVRTSDPDSVRLLTSDVETFWQAYGRLAGSATREDSLRVLAEVYFGRASPGLAAFIDERLRRPEALLFALDRLPRYYAAVRGNTLRLAEHVPVLREGFRRLQRLYPEATFPDVYS